MSKQIFTSGMLTLIAAGALVAGDVRAQVPGEFIYEGYLEESNAPVTGSRMMSFGLYPDPSGGTAVWIEGPKSVTITDGYFAVIIGDTTAIDPADVLAAPYLEVVVASTTLGRQALAAVPFALQAGAVRWADIVGIPAGFADNQDDVASGSGGGTVTSIAVGTGLTATTNPITVNGTINIDFGTNAGQVAAGNHTHDLRYYTETEADTNFAAALHNHDVRYYTQTAADGLFSQIGHSHSNYALTSHNHDTAYAPTAHAHDGAAINTGTVGTNYYSAIADLTAEGQLDNNANTDLLTRAQSDGRYVQPGGNPSFGTLTATSLNLTNPPNITNKPLRTMLWAAGPNSMFYDFGVGETGASGCFKIINGRGACQVNAGQTMRVVVETFLNAVPDGVTITSWGMHTGGSTSTVPDPWTCDLKYGNTLVDTLSFNIGSGDYWHLDSHSLASPHVVNNAPPATTPVDYTDDLSWKVTCTSGEIQTGRLDLKYIWIRYTEP